MNYENRKISTEERLNTCERKIQALNEAVMGVMISTIVLLIIFTVTVAILATR